jgi:hypothetical protein
MHSLLVAAAFLAIGSGGKPLKGAARTASRRSVRGSKANGFLPRVMSEVAH